MAFIPPNMFEILVTAAWDTGERICNDIYAFLEAPQENRMEFLPNAVSAISWYFGEQHDYQMTLNDMARILETDAEHERFLAFRTARQYWCADAVALMESQIGTERMRIVLCTYATVSKAG